MPKNEETASDTVNGTATDTDTVQGGAGSDTIQGGAGSDTIQGGATADVVTLPETKRQIFIRLATKRTQNAVHAIGLLEGLTNKANYDYTPGHWAAVRSALDKAISELDAAIAGQPKPVVGFDLGAVKDDEGEQEDKGAAE